MLRTPCLMLAAMLWLFGCHIKSPDNMSASKANNIPYPYTLKDADHWITDTGSENTMAALKVLKAFEKNDTGEMRKYFMDTLIATYDGGKFKGPLGKFLGFIKTKRDSLKVVAIKLYDKQAVTSRDNTEAWVTTWLLQVSTNWNGKTDSIEYIHDMLFRNGKIAKLDEYVRHCKM